eukprot:scaffold4060_cov190-Amphora_coffeaeformis.AAC.23
MLSRSVLGVGPPARRSYYLSRRAMMRTVSVLATTSTTLPQQSTTLTASTKSPRATATSTSTSTSTTTTTTLWNNINNNKWPLSPLLSLSSSSSPFSFSIRHFSSKPPGGNNNNNNNGMQLPPWMMMGHQNAKPGEYLDLYTTNLTQWAADGKLDPIIGRHEEIRRCLQILARRTKNSEYYYYMCNTKCKRERESMTARVC